MTKLPVVLAIFLYLLIYWLRTLQGGWEPKFDVFPAFRQNLDQRINNLLPSPQAQLLSGILLGNKKDLPAQFRLALRDTSTLHIVVASGQNLSMVAGFFLSLSGLIKRKNAIILSLLAVTLYSLLTGLQVPIVRAAVMFSLASLAQLVGRDKDGGWALVVTGALMLLINPKWLMDLSFQLSFLATAGVIIVAPILLKYFKLVPLLGQDLAVTLGAQVMIAPIIAQNFHQISLVGILANILVGWTIPPVMILGSLMIILGSVFSPVVNIFLTYFIYIVQFFASLPFAWEYVGEQLWIVWLGYYLILFSVVLSLNYAKTENSTRP